MEEVRGSSPLCSKLNFFSLGFYRSLMVRGRATLVLLGSRVSAGRREGFFQVFEFSGFCVGDRYVDLLITAGSFAWFF